MQKYLVSPHLCPFVDLSPSTELILLSVIFTCVPLYSTEVQEIQLSSVTQSEHSWCSLHLLYRIKRVLSKSNEQLGLATLPWALGHM